MTQDELAAIRARADAATPGPWVKNWRDIPALLAEITQLRAMLRQLEWRHEYAEEMWPDGLKECVVCHNRKMNGHAIGCALAALLSEEES